MGKILSISGKTGSGKTTLENYLLKKHKNFTSVISYTTRDKRDSDPEGDYIYLTKDEFSKMQTEHKFIWTAQYVDTYYGTTKESVDEILKSEKVGTMVLLPEVLPKLENYLKDKEQLQNYIPVFIEISSHDSLRERLSKRGDKAEIVEQRLQKDEVEFKEYPLRYTTPIIVENNSDIQTFLDQAEKLILQKTNN